MLSVKSGIEPVTASFATVVDTAEASVFMVSTVGVRLVGVDVEVHHIPKLAMARYMYFAGLVKDKVGVTLCQWNQRPCT
jgi:hypothetical protein